MFNSKKSGKEIIADSLAGFEKIVKDLDHGIELCNQEENDINEKIFDLNSQRSVVRTVKDRAINVKNNISKLLSAS